MAYPFQSLLLRGTYDRALTGRSSSTVSTVQGTGYAKNGPGSPDTFRTLDAEKMAGRPPLSNLTKVLISTLCKHPSTDYLHARAIQGIAWKKLPFHFDADKRYARRNLSVVKTLFKDEVERAKEAAERVRVEKTQPTIFTKIINKEVPASIVYEDDQCLAFDDVSPQAPSHVLVIPKRQLPMLSDAEEGDAAVSGGVRRTDRPGAFVDSVYTISFGGVGNLVWYETIGVCWVKYR